MPGFLGYIGKKVKQSIFDKNQRQDLVNDIISNDLIYLERRTVNKFLNDKVFIEDDEFIVVTEGVILNSLELIEKYKCKCLSETIIEMYRKNGNEFFGEFRGSFSGFLYDKKNDKKIIYTDHIGDKQIFYSKVDNGFVFASEINYIIEYYNKNNIKYSLNEAGAYYLLTYGYMLEDNTLFADIKKLIAGHYILVENDNMDIIQYFKLDNDSNYNLTEDEIIENIDVLFKQAIKRAFEKDKEYGYKHLVALSGGLDSRMTTWVANDMGYGHNIVNYTFSQSDYLDETIAKKIASDLKHEWIFKFLDNGLFLINLEEVVKISSGGALYYGLAHGKSCLDLINLDRFGTIHSGQLGDVIIGTFFSSLDNNKEFSIGDGAYSKLLINKLDKYNHKLKYKNEEIFKFYNRGFNGANQGLLISQESTETYSPFYDLDFLKYCLQIPLDLRYNHKIYFKWILRKYKKAADYTWESINGKITEKKVNILGRQIPLKQIPVKTINYLKRKIGIRNSALSSKNHMNPLDYWYGTNKELRDFMDNYYESNINRLSLNKELMNDCKYLYKKGDNIEKNQVLTLLSVLKLYF